MSDRTGGMRQSDAARRTRAYVRAYEELGVYFDGDRGKLRLLGFICQVLVATAIVFTLFSMIEAGSYLLHAILMVAETPLLAGDTRNVLFAEHSARRFIVDASEALVRDVPFNAIAAITLTVTAELYWTRRRARRLMPPSDFL